MALMEPIPLLVAEDIEIKNIEDLEGFSIVTLDDWVIRHYYDMVKTTERGGRL